MDFTHILEEQRAAIQIPMRVPRLEIRLRQRHGVEVDLGVPAILIRLLLDLGLVIDHERRHIDSHLERVTASFVLSKGLGEDDSEFVEAVLANALLFSQTVRLFCKHASV
jgi:hypothetical protein